MYKFGIKIRKVEIAIVWHKNQTMYGKCESNSILSDLKFTKSDICHYFQCSAFDQQIKIRLFISTCNTFQLKIELKAPSWVFFSITLPQGTLALNQLNLIPASQISFKAPGVSIICVIKQIQNWCFCCICLPAMLKVMDQCLSSKQNCTNLILSYERQPVSA